MKKLISISFLLGIITISRSTIINVPGDYTTIQAAINNAGDGDTISCCAWHLQRAS